MRTLWRPVRLFPPGLSVAPDALILSAELPEPLQELAVGVVKRSRLWHSERLDVARELVAHFKDGLEAGATPGDLAAAFGDPRNAARLIRRAKKRCRPLAWRAMLACVKSIALLAGLMVATYLFFGARAYLSHPTITRNYTAEINARIASIPEPERAWPLYRAAYLALPRMPEVIAKDFPAIDPGEERWPVAMTYLHDCSRTLDLLRQGAARPHLGRPVSNTYEAELDAHSRYLSGIDRDKARTDAFADAAGRAEDANPELIGVLLPHLGQARQFARLLVLDARAAAASGDGARVTSDLETMYRIAGHVRENSFLIGDLVGLAVDSLACETLGTILAEEPSILSNSQIATLAHAAATCPRSIELGGERLFMADTLQRVYTDDGHGDGHLTAAGVRMMFSYSMSSGESGKRIPDSVRDTLELPLVTGIAASRRAVAEQYDRMLDSTLAYAALKPWLRPDESPSAQVEKLSNSFNGNRYLLVSLLMPALNRVVWAHEEAMQRRDALLVAIAAELYRREHGAYPARLQDIPVSILPSIPPDAFDGNPLRYTLRDGKPLIYSIGTDRKDDGGRPSKGTATSTGRWMSRAAAEATLASGQADTIDGDWILWPPAVSEPKGP